MINRRTQQLDSRRLALEEHLKQLNEQLAEIDERNFSVDGEKKNLEEMISFLKATEDQNSILKEIEKSAFGKLNNLAVV